uniref:Protein AAR2 homolog n=1 Tax=Saccoglossus kowalevskii TaxID=10224 RepID=A0ABM0LZA4_SACKO|nr:PREDICTED: LOW QUALITY PROTEIN: protein AAR2 homolog [Saccoglossus kowalevskii]
MAAKQTKKDDKEEASMDPKTARKLFDEGAMLVFLDVPAGTEFGIDYNSWTVGTRFRGVKMIPPGLHFIYYSAISQGSTNVGMRTGFFHYFKQREILVKKWDVRLEDISDYQPTEDEIKQYKCNRRELDSFMGPYPYHSLKQWVSLSTFVSETLMNSLIPDNGKIQSVTELIGDKESRTTEQRAEIRASLPEDATVEQQMPQMHVNPETKIKFTEIPTKHPTNANPEQLTKYNMDSTYSLQTLIESQYEANKLDLLGEMQFAFICFLLGQVYDAFEHWKSLVHLLCSAQEAISTHSDLYNSFITVLYFQLGEIPKDFFIDIVSSNNFLTTCLTEFFQNLEDSSAHEELKSRGRKFKKSLTRKFKWDFDDLECGEYAPQVVMF